MSFRIFTLSHLRDALFTDRSSPKKRQSRPARPDGDMVRAFVWRGSSASRAHSIVFGVHRIARLELGHFRGIIAAPAHLAQGDVIEQILKHYGPAEFDCPSTFDWLHVQHLTLPDLRVTMERGKLVRE